MIYYKSRYLSERLGINLAKWKRWSRDFLSPDPLGGLQSGVARQFNLKDAFKVYFGGYLVGVLKFTIPDAKQIVTDLTPWLKKHGFFSYETQIKTDDAITIPDYLIFIYPMPDNTWSYTVKTIISASHLDEATEQAEVFAQTLINTANDPISDGKACSAYLIAISTLFKTFWVKIA